MQTQANYTFLLLFSVFWGHFCSLHWTRLWPSLYKCFTHLLHIRHSLLEGRRQHRGAFSRPSFQQFHRAKARAQCSGPSGKGIQRKEEQMPQQGLGEEPVSLRTLPQLSHLFMPTSPDSHHHMVAPLRLQPCHPKGRTPQPLGLQQAHRPLCQDTLPLSLHSANPLVIRWTLLKHTSLSPLLFKHYGAQLGIKFSVGIQGGYCWANLKLPLQPSSSSSPFTREYPNWKKRFFFNSSFLLHLLMHHLFFKSNICFLHIFPDCLPKHYDHWICLFLWVP